jgi:prepilin-type N-terminal cleavage/methylation domain-containing protein
MRREDGFTIIEVLVAILILATGAAAVLGVFDAATRNSFRVEETQVAVNRAQRELEQIRQLGYEDVALTATPAHSSDPDDPRYRVSGNGFAVGWNGTTPSSYAEMAVRNIGGLEAGSVSPGPTTFQSGDIRGKVYRYVVWQDDPRCQQVQGSGLNACPGPRDYKRVVVIVKLDNAPISYARSYTEVQSNVGDPDAATQTSSDPGAGGPVLTAQQFFLSDTTCNHSERQDVQVDSGSDGHAEHQTWGTCDEPNPLKPDGLYTDAPPDPDPEDPSNPPLYDYATDVEPSLNPDQDKGLQLYRQDVDGCTFQPSGPQYKIHRWVSQPLTQAFQMSGKATLEFYTRTINDVSAQGRICVFVFVRSETQSNGQTVATDTRLVDSSNPPNAFFVYSENPWPSGAWTRRRFDMSFAATNIQASNATTTRRVGLEIAVRRNGTTGDVLEFMYDHPDDPSRLEVETTTPLP